LSSEKPLRILIVEDEILIALELESLLQDLGHDVVGMAASSRDALSLGQELKTGRPASTWRAISQPSIRSPCCS
jgi:CheY-like chemotaxis protein